MTSTDQHPVLLFDGHCNLCNGAVQWVLARDKEGVIRFASLQSEVGQRLQEQFKLDPAALDSIVLVKNKQAYQKSTAALETAASMGGIYSVANVFKVVPAFIRNAVYDFVARNRYRWFGRSEECWLPRPEWKERFLD
ncbi:thiol-disulfide oxidoreductase [Lewinellaceae bacterium SD302]|nr:thiol-disulfide oxidoreductase [Lewinellaceae bacterium SD302]